MVTWSRAERVRSLTDDLRRRDDPALARLLSARPDLARPTPSDVAALAARAATRPSVRRAMEGLDRGRLHTLEALVVSGADTVHLDVAAHLLGVEAPRLDTIVDELWSAALLWGSTDDLHVVRAVVDLLGPHVAGLAPVDPGRTPLTASDVEARLAHVSDQARAILERLMWGPPTGTLGDDSALAASVSALVKADLLRRTHDGVLLPREVALALRGGRLHRSNDLDPPTPTTRPVRASSVAATAAGAASLLLERLDELAATWGTTPARVLRAGGLAVRDLRRLADTLDLTVEHTALLVEIAWAAGLVDDDGELDPSWAPTAYYDEWHDAPAAGRWARVATAWATSTRAPHLVGTHRARTPAAAPTLVNALSPDATWPGARPTRHAVLDELASLPDGVFATTQDVLDLLAWRMPLRLGDAVRQAVPAVLDEAEFIGVLGGGALGPAGRALAAGAAPDAVAAALEPDLPEPAVDILLQGDLTAVAPGRVEGELAGFLRLAADLESRGGAAVYRFSESGIRRCLDAGWSADDILTALRTHSRTPVPQALDYLVTDVARRHGHARVGAVSSYVRSDDPGVLDAIEARPEMVAARLRRLAPTVLVSAAPPAILLDLLRTHGVPAVVESPDGGLVSAGVPTARARSRRARAAPLLRTTVDDLEAAALVAAICDGDAAARAAAERGGTDGPDLPSSDPSVTLALVREAIAERTGVWIGVTDAQGVARRLLLRPERIEGGRITGTVGTSDIPRTFSVHRITGAAAG